MSKTLLKQVEQVRDSGIVNMLDYPKVHDLAYEAGLDELAEFIEEDKNGYFQLVMFGKLPKED